MIAPLPAWRALAATVSAADAARVPWQAVVVGAGPAGAAAAWRLAEQGLRVMLFDRHEWPRSKVCGCCLSTRAVRELRALGPTALPAASVPLAAVRLVHRGRSCRIPLPAGRVVSREVLDAGLVRGAIAAGCQWLPATNVAAIRDGADAVEVDIVADHGTAAAPRTPGVRADLVVLATGLAETVRITGDRGTMNGAGPARSVRQIARGSRIGAGAALDADASALPAGELVMVVGRHGYGGLVRLEDGRIDVAAALDRGSIARDGDPAAAVARLLAEAAAGGACPLPGPDAIRAAAFRATPPLTRRVEPVAGETRRILRIGDAADYVEPFTGEGMGWALESARLLAESVLARHGLRPPREAAERYVAARRAHLVPLHARCRLVAAGLRRPAVVATAIAAARAVPWAARRILPAVIGAAHPGEDP